MWFKLIIFTVKNTHYLVKATWKTLQDTKTLPIDRKYLKNKTDFASFKRGTNVKKADGTVTNIEATKCSQTKIILHTYMNGHILCKNSESIDIFRDIFQPVCNHEDLDFSQQLSDIIKRLQKNITDAEEAIAKIEEYKLELSENQNLKKEQMVKLKSTYDVSKLLKRLQSVSKNSLSAINTLDKSVLMKHNYFFNKNLEKDLLRLKFRKFFNNTSDNTQQITTRILGNLTNINMISKNFEKIPPKHEHSVTKETAVKFISNLIPFMVFRLFEKYRYKNLAENQDLVDVQKNVERLNELVAKLEAKLEEYEGSIPIDVLIEIIKNCL